MTGHFTDAELADARTRGDIIAADLPLKRKGHELFGLCPFHNEKTPSFYVFADGHFHCFGCGAHGDAIAYVMRRRGLAFQDAVREILGLPEQRPRLERAPPPELAPNDAGDRRVEVAEILAGCVPIGPTTAAHLYLWSRGLPGRQPSLIAHPALECWELGRDETGAVRKLPALVAPIVNSIGEVNAVQRIWVARSFIPGDQPDARAPLKTRKKTLGIMGDGAVRLRDADHRLGLAEGVETALAAAQLFCQPVWAVCGAARLGLVWIPDYVEQLTIYADNGATGEELAFRAVDNLKRRGTAAEIVFPEERFGDFNDQLLGRLS